MTSNHGRFVASLGAILMLVAVLPIGAAAEEGDVVAASDDTVRLQYGADNPRPGQPGHRGHEEWEGDYPSLADLGNFQVRRVFAPPDGFLGNLTYDPAGDRLFLVSFGRPINTGGSRLYEVARADGRVLRETSLPLEGDLASPVFLDGHLFVGVFHESKMYKISVGKESFGEVVKVIDLPTLNDLKLVNESHPVPYIEFGGVTITGDERIMIHADDVGEFISLEPDSGEIVARTRTLKALGGITGVDAGEQGFLVVANSDPRGGYCALSYPPELSRSAEQKDISWALLNGDTGEVLASIRRQNSRAYAGTVALTDYRRDDRSPYGTFTFLATGEEGVLEITWTPDRDAF